jgi:hypothetical protein
MTDDHDEYTNRLTNNWTLVIDKRETGKELHQDFPPLLDMLATMVRPNMERTGGGSSAATRNLIDTKALTLLMHIEDVSRAWLIEWGIKVTGDRKADVAAYSERANTLHRTGVITETDWLRLTSYPQTWVGRIWDLIEPPMQIPLKEAECPKCGRAKWINENDEHVDNILASYRDGGEVQAECRWNDCDGYWVGPRQLRELGFHVGATVDDDALREMGYDVMNTP